MLVSAMLARPSIKGWCFQSFDLRYALRKFISLQSISRHNAKHTVFIKYSYVILN